MCVFCCSSSRVNCSILPQLEMGRRDHHHNAHQRTFPPLLFFLCLAIPPTTHKHKRAQKPKHMSYYITFPPSSFGRSSGKARRRAGRDQGGTGDRLSVSHTEGGNSYFIPLTHCSVCIHTHTHRGIGTRRQQGISLSSPGPLIEELRAVSVCRTSPSKHDE